MNNLSSYCGLVDAKIRASDKDLPVIESVARIRIFVHNGGIIDIPNNIFFTS